MISLRRQALALGSGDRREGVLPNEARADEKGERGETTNLLLVSGAEESGELSGRGKSEKLSTATIHPFRPSIYRCHRRLRLRNDDCRKFRLLRPWWTRTDATDRHQREREREPAHILLIRDAVCLSSAYGRSVGRSRRQMDGRVMFFAIICTLTGCSTWSKRQDHQPSCFHSSHQPHFCEQIRVVRTRESYTR